APRIHPRPDTNPGRADSLHSPNPSRRGRLTPNEASGHAGAAQNPSSTPGGCGLCGLVWAGVGWCGLVWAGVGWCGLVWADKVAHRKPCR
ncbi:hypothetical protein E1263_42315, partial [Kribbella antibiotica]